VQELCAEIRSFRSNCANDDVTALETSLLDCYGLLHLHHVSIYFCELCDEILFFEVVLLSLLVFTMHRANNSSDLSIFFPCQYLDVPFLRLKQRSLQEQLAAIESDLHLCHAEIEHKVQTTKYDDYLRQYNARKR